MTRRTTVGSLVVTGALLAGLVTTQGRGQERRPELAPWAATMLGAVNGLAAALSAADKVELQARCSPELWARLAPSFAEPRARGSLGHFERTDNGWLAKPGVAVCFVLCRQPDGVEDVLMVTMRQQGDTWKACGGLGSVTPANPLR